MEETMLAEVREGLIEAPAEAVEVEEDFVLEAGEEAPVFVRYYVPGPRPGGNPEIS